MAFRVKKKASNPFRQAEHKWQQDAGGTFQVLEVGVHGTRASLDKWRTCGAVVPSPRWADNLLVQTTSRLCCRHNWSDQFPYVKQTCHGSHSTRRIFCQANNKKREVCCSVMWAN